MLTHRLFRRTTLAALLLSLGCATWQPAAEAPAVLILEQQPPRVRLTLDDGSHVVVRAPRLIEDSIHGTPERCEWVRGLDGQQRCVNAVAPMIALDRVMGVETQATSAGGTAAAVIAVPLVIFGLIAASGCSGWC